MDTFVPEHPRARDISFERDCMVVSLVDGRVIMVPLEWYPSLRDATDEQRTKFRMIGDGIGVHWPDLDEDLSVRGFLMPHALPKAG